MDCATLFLTALIALVVWYGEPNDRSLQTIRALLTSPEKLDMAVTLMCASDAWNGMLARLGGQLRTFVDRERASVLSTTHRLSNFLDTLAIFESTTTSNFNPEHLRSGKMTIFLILPFEHAKAQVSLLRMWVGSMFRAVVRGGLQEENLVNFVLDEAGNLGHMEALDDAVNQYRGYGVRIIFFYQALGQLKKCFPDGQDETLLSNVTQVFFAVNDLQTAEYVSNRLGDETIIVRSGGTSWGTSRQSSIKGDSSNSDSTNQNDNWAQQGRKLLKTEEVLSLSPRTAITFARGVYPICTQLVPYYEESLLPREPGKWEEFKAMMHIVLTSVSLLFVMVILAMYFRENGRREIHFEQHHFRKTGEIWRKTSSKSWQKR